MSNIEKYISPLVESQFPDFIREQGPLFLLFVEEYYKWLEDNSNLYASYDDALVDGNPLYHARRLLEYKDIDRTVDEFIVNIKEKYLKNIQFETNISKRRLIKAAHDMYGAKGSNRSLELFFKLLYGTKIEIYTPGDNILKPSDGTWVIPKYLELTQSPRNITFPGKQVTGSVSGATAFVEYIITRNINGKLIDVAFLSNLQGNFSTDEVITDDGIFLNAPKIIGSLTSIDITTPGELFEIGEIVNIVSPSGVEGLARVATIDSVTGVVRFSIIDGGWGFSNTAETTVSAKTISISNVYNTNASITAFFRDETLTQNLFSFNVSDVPEVITNGVDIKNGNTSTPSLSVVALSTQNTTTAYTSNNANLVLNQLSANVFTSNIIFENHRAIIVTNTNVSFSIGDLVVQRTGSTNNTFGVIESVSNVTALSVNTTSIGSNGIHVGTYIEQATSNASGYVTAIPRENLFTYTNVSAVSVGGVTGTFNNTSTITAYTNSAKTTTLTTFEPLDAQLAFRYVLSDTNLTTNTRWSTSNTVVLVGAPTINASIILASDIGGKYTSSSNVSATANIFAQNTTHIGLTSLLGTFYANEKTVVYGLTSNTFANTTTVFTGSAANLFVGIISDSETVRLSPDLISSNNTGGASSVRFKDMLISGANSTFGNVSSVFINNGGSGYNNTNIVTFSGGNTGAGSYGVGNASIVTDASGVITDVTLTSNVGNLIVSTPTASIVNSSGGSTGIGSGASLIPVSSLGFVKLPGGDITTPLIDILRFETKTIGTIASLTNINPGENYNINPFVLVYEPYVASYGKRDFIATITITAGAGYVNNEVVTQTISTPGIQITSNTFTGNSANSYEVFEVVYSTDGISNTATGIVYSTTRNITTGVHTTILTSNTGTWQNSINVSILTVLSNTNFNPGNKILQSTTANGILVTSNSTTLVVSNVQGTFTSGTVTSNASPTPGSTTASVSTNTVIYTLNGLTSNGTSYISNTQAYTASATAKGRVKSNSNTSYLEIKRISLFTDFTPGGTLTGGTTGTTATILSVGDDLSSLITGDNANIVANVVASEGRITSLNVVDSGYGYINDEQLTLTSLDGLRVATGQANVAKQGIGLGFYSSTRGFLDDDMYLHDGDYYQNFSYEIQSPIPLDKYSDVLKKVLHISGKKLFGRVVTAPFIEANITSNSTITIV